MKTALLCRPCVALCLIVCCTITIFVPPVQAGAKETVRWERPVSGSWSEAANWSTGKVPQADQAVVIDAPGGYTIKLDVGASIASLTLGTARASRRKQILIVGEQRLVLAGNSTIRASGILHLAGSALDSGRSLTIAGAFKWTGGALGGRGYRYVKPGGLFNAGGNADKRLAQGSVLNRGLMNWGGRGHISCSDGVSVDNYNVFNLRNRSTAINEQKRAGATFHNQKGGKLTGSGTLDGDLINSGIITIVATRPVTMDKVQQPQAPVARRHGYTIITRSSALITGIGGGNISVPGTYDSRSGSETNIKIVNTTTYGYINATGAATINGGTLNVTVDAAFTPRVGQIYDIIRGHPLKRINDFSPRNMASRAVWKFSPKIHSGTNPRFYRLTVATGP